MGYMQEEKVIAELEAYLEQLVADDQFSGTVLVAKDAWRKRANQRDQSRGVDSGDRLRHFDIRRSDVPCVSLLLPEEPQQ